jgi:putative DNA primase/helicase
MTGLSAAELRRAQSWNVVVASIILGSDVPFQDVGHDRRWSGLGGFSVDRRDGAWFSFATAAGGHSTLAMVRFLQQGSAWTDAEAWVLSFLTKNPGTGPCDIHVDDDDDSQWRRQLNAERARKILDKAGPISGTDGERYLISRGLGPAPYPLDLKWLPDARTGEGAIVVELIASGRTVAILITYVDALGCKSTVIPNRQRLNIEPNQPGAIIEIAAATPGATDIVADTIICEGLENGLSLALVRSPPQRIVALPGIAALKHVKVRKGERATVFQDSDDAGHPALEGLQAGIDALLSAGAKVRKTKWHPAGDANDILRTEGLDALKRCLADTEEAVLSFAGEVERLAKLSLTEYEKVRKQIAAKHGVRVGHLDREVARQRQAANPKPDPKEEDEPWTDPIPPLGKILNALVGEIYRYVALECWQAHIIALWVVLTFFVHHTKVTLSVMPRLAIQSAEASSGKTTLLRILCTLVWRGEIFGRTSVAGIYRAISADPRTLLLDEVEHLITDRHSPFLPVLDSSHHREDATILLTETRPDGSVVPIRLSTWAAMGLASNGALPVALQSRCHVILLKKALPGEVPDRLRTRRTPELISLHRQLDASAAGVTALPMPNKGEMPAGVYNRAADNFEPLFAVAGQGGNRWLRRIRQAADASLRTEHLPTHTARLLASVKLAFGEDVKPDTFLDTEELAARLAAQTGENWDTANNRHPVNEYWFRKHLIGLLKPPGAQQRQEPLPGGSRRHRRGYYYHQFNDAFRRHLTEEDAHTYAPAEGVLASGTSGTSGTAPSKAAETANSAVPDTFWWEKYPVPPSGTENPKETAAETPAVPDVPDVPDATAPIRARMDGHAAPPTAESSSPTDPPKPQQNGHDREAFSRRHAIDPMVLAAILAFLDANPDASAAQIRKAIGAKPSVIKRVLDEWKPGP